MQTEEREKHKTTIKFVKENWIKLQNLAAIQNTSPTQILNDYVEALVNDNLPENYEKRIQDKVCGELDQRITDELVEAIALRVASHLRLKLDTDSTANTAKIIKTVDVSRQKQIDNTDSTDESISIASTANTAKKKTKKKTVDPDRKAANIAKFKRYKASDNKRSYDDKYVASQEGVAKGTVWRYRKGERSPKQEFIDNWGLNWNGEQWIKN